MNVYVNILAWKDVCFYCFCHSVGAGGALLKLKLSLLFGFYFIKIF